MAALTTPEQAAAFVAQYDVVDPPHTFAIPVPDTKPAETKPAVATVATPESPAAPALIASAPVKPVAENVQSPVPAVVPAPSTPVATVATVHPEWLTKEATTIGIPAYIQSHLPTDVLTQAVMERLRQPAPVATVATPQPVPAQVPVTPTPPAFNWGTFDETGAQGRVIAKKTYTDADIDPAIAAHIKLLHQEIATLKQFQTGVTHQVQTSQEQQITAMFDTAFNTVPQVFGTGAAKDVKDKPEYARRQAVYNAVKGMLQGLPANLKGSISVPQAIAIQAKALFGVDIANPVATVATGQPTPQQFQNGQVAQPTQKKAATPQPGRDTAVSAATEWWSQNVTNNNGTPASADTQLSEFF